MKKYIHLGFCCLLSGIVHAHAPATVHYDAPTASSSRDAKTSRILACVGRVIEGLIKVIKDPHNKPSVLVNVGEMLSGVFDIAAHALPHHELNEQEAQEFRQLLHDINAMVEPMLRQYVSEQSRSMRNYLHAIALDELDSRIKRSDMHFSAEDLAVIPAGNEHEQELHGNMLNALHGLVQNLFAIIQNPENPQLVGQSIADMLANIMNVASQTLKYEYLSSSDAEENVALYLESFSNELTKEIKHMMLQTALHLRGGNCGCSSKSCCNTCSKNSCSSSCNSCSSSAVCKPCCKPCNSCCRTAAMTEEAQAEEAVRCEEVAEYRENTEMAETRKSCCGCSSCTCSSGSCGTCCNTCKTSCCKSVAVEQAVMRTSCSSCSTCSCKPSCKDSCSSCKQSCCSFRAPAAEDAANKCGCNKPKPKPPVVENEMVDRKSCGSSCNTCGKTSGCGCHKSVEAPMTQDEMTDRKSSCCSSCGKDSCNCGCKSVEAMAQDAENKCCGKPKPKPPVVQNEMTDRKSCGSCNTCGKTSGCGCHKSVDTSCCTDSLFNTQPRPNKRSSKKHMPVNVQYAERYASGREAQLMSADQEARRHG